MKASELLREHTALFQALWRGSPAVRSGGAYLCLSFLSCCLTHCASGGRLFVLWGRPIPWRHPQGASRLPFHREHRALSRQPSEANARRSSVRRGCICLGHLVSLLWLALALHSFLWPALPPWLRLVDHAELHHKLVHQEADYRARGDDLFRKTHQGLYGASSCDGRYDLLDEWLEIRTCDDYDRARLPVVRGGICLSSSEAILCSSEPRTHSLPSLGVGHFHVRQRELPIRRGDCPPSHTWHRGQHVLLDNKFIGMRNGRRGGCRPQPMHEAEKLLPAIAIRCIQRQRHVGVTWFTDRECLSPMSQGVIEAFSDCLEADRPGDSLQGLFGSLPAEGEPPICFEDAAIVQLVPGHGGEHILSGHNLSQALRQQVFAFCGMPEPQAAVWPPRHLVMYNRTPRRLQNAGDVEAALLAGFPSIKSLTHVEAGSAPLCEQIAPFTRADLIVQPHGSHQLATIYAPYGAVLVEVQPFHYHTHGPHMFLARLGQGFRVYDSPGAFAGRADPRSYLYRHLGPDDCRHWKACYQFNRSSRVKANVSDIVAMLNTL